MKRILIGKNIPKSCLTPYRDRYIFTVPEKSFTQEQVKDQIAEHDAYLVIEAPCDRKILERGRRLKAVANLGIGYDNIDWRYATEKGIAVVNTPTQVTDATAELTIALITSVMREVVRYDKEIRRNIWNLPLFTDINCELTGKTLGILGFDRIGKAVCKKARGLGMNVIYYDKVRAHIDLESQYETTFMEFDQVLEKSDCISIHVPYLPENHHLFRKETYDKMKDGAYLVNAARGPLLEEETLAEALENGKLRGVTLDVFEFEPKVNERLLKFDNVILTPHLASSSMAARVGMCNEALADIAGVLENETIDNVINPEVMIMREAMKMRG